MTYLHRALAPETDSRVKSFVEVVRNFTPNWFAATMGTGALALVLNQFPLPLVGLHAAAVGLWLLNIGLFALFGLLYAARSISFSKRRSGFSIIRSCRCSSAQFRWGWRRS